MLHRIREAMKREPIAGLLSGRVVADETWYGGKPRNRHGHDPKQQHARAQHDKTPIMSLVSRETGEVRSRVMNDVKPDNLRCVLHEHIDPKRDTSAHRLRPAVPSARDASSRSHERSTTDAREYVRGDVSTNQAESYFAS